MFGKSKVLLAKIDELNGTIRAMAAASRISKRRHLLAKKNRDKEIGRLAKEIAKEQKKIAKMDGLLELERLAELEHNQWVYWTQQIADQVPEQLKELWEKSWIPYSELSEEIKEHDRIWARKILEEK